MVKNQLFEEILNEGTHSNKRPFESAWPQGDFPVPKPMGWANQNGEDPGKIKSYKGGRMKRDYQAQPATNPPIVGRKDYEVKYAKGSDKLTESKEFSLLREAMIGAHRHGPSFDPDQMMERETCIRELLKDERCPGGLFDEMVKKYEYVITRGKDPELENTEDEEGEDEYNLLTLINDHLEKSAEEMGWDPEECYISDEDYDEIAAPHIYEFILEAQNKAKENYKKYSESQG